MTLKKNIKNNQHFKMRYIKKVILAKNKRKRVEYIKEYKYKTVDRF